MRGSRSSPRGVCCRERLWGRIRRGRFASPPGQGDVWGSRWPRAGRSRAGLGEQVTGGMRRGGMRCAGCFPSGQGGLSSNLVSFCDLRLPWGARGAARPPWLSFSRALWSRLSRCFSGSGGCCEVSWGYLSLLRTASPAGAALLFGMGLVTRGGGRLQEMTARGFQPCQGCGGDGATPLPLRSHGPAAAAGDEPFDRPLSPVLPTLEPRFVGPVGQLRPACAQNFLWFSTWVSLGSQI